MEIMPRVGRNDRIEIVTEGGNPVEQIEPLEPMDAAFLARSILATAVALMAHDKPRPGELIGDAQIPVAEWETKTSAISGNPVLIFHFPPGIQMTFELTIEGAKEMGTALMMAQEVLRRPVHRSGSVH